MAQRVVDDSLEGLRRPPVEAEQPLAPAAADTVDAGSAGKVVQNHGEGEPVARPVVVLLLDRHHTGAAARVGELIVVNQLPGDAVGHRRMDGFPALPQSQGDRIRILHLFPSRLQPSR